MDKFTAGERVTQTVDVGTFFGTVTAIAADGWIYVKWDGLPGTQQVEPARLTLAPREGESLEAIVARADGGA